MGIKPTADVRGSHGFSQLPEHKQTQFKQSYGEFYGVGKQDAAKLDYNKLYQASRDNKAKEDPLAKVPDQVKQDATFKADMKKFFDVKQSDTSSVYKHNTS